MRQLLILFIAISFTSIGNVFAHKIEASGKEEPLQALDHTEKGIGSIEKSVNRQPKAEPVFENTLDEDKEIESDSSYYSVNKFNILFYFVYKLKYGDEELPTHE